MQIFSKNQIAAIFGVNRATVYSWIALGCPGSPALRPGAPAALDFECVLEWRLCHLESLGASEAGLVLADKVVRERLRKFLDRQKGQVCTEKEVQTSAEQI
ncbi:MAG: hypothetical protein ABL983_03565 [Nitrospira sp.]